MSLRDLQKKVFLEYKRNGYLEVWDKKGKVGIIAELGLIVTEIAEAMEEARNKKFNKDAFMFECTDTIIRTLNLMSRLHGDAEHYILLKHEINMQRERLHGRAVIEC